MSSEELISVVYMYNSLKTASRAQSGETKREQTRLGILEQACLRTDKVDIGCTACLMADVVRGH